DICAFNHGGNIDGGPWKNLDNHGKEITTLPANAFTEVGVDITNVLGESPCLSTFMGKTRSSASFTSELKDFAGPTKFAICAPSTKMTKTAVDANGDPVSTVHSGDEVDYTYTDENDGKDPLTPPSACNASAPFTCSTPTALDRNSVVTDDTCSPVTYVSGDTNNDNVLDPKEIWHFTCGPTNPTGDVTNTALGFGVDLLLNKMVRWCTATELAAYPPPAVGPPGVFCDQDETAQATVTVINPSTLLTKTASAVVTYN